MKIRLEFDLDNDDDAKRYKNALAADRCAYLIDDFLDFLSITENVATMTDLTPKKLFDHIYGVYRTKIITLGLKDIIQLDLCYVLEKFEPIADE